ncbi:hypothetical protein [Viridibacillus arvi]|uniref:hypothetical protein n=1 Tax=Viridibacillus arvi TaxID=263475 RepID=UPI003D2CAD2B
MTNNSVYENVTAILRDKFENSAKFNETLDNITIFYGRKLLSITKNHFTREIIEKTIEKVIREQYFEGYFRMSDIIKNSGIPAIDLLWELPKGRLRNEVRILLENVYKDIDPDWANNATISNFSLVMLKELEEGFDVVEMIKYEVAAFGAWEAVIEDSRYVYKEDADEFDSKFGNSFDLEFINFQVYMQMEYFSDTYESWNLYKLGKNDQDNIGCGMAQLSLIHNLEGKQQFVLTLNLFNLIHPEEKNGLVDSIVKSITSKLKNSELHIRILHTTEIEYFSFSNS